MLGEDQLVIAIGAAARVKESSFKAGAESAQRITL
jgi:hypothetical protein